MAQPDVRTIDEHPERVRFPLMELPLVGFFLAFMAGTLNAWTLANASTFSTVQSGNVVSVGYYLIQANWDKLWFPVGAIIAFGLGSAACGVLMTNRLRKGHVYTRSVLVIQIVLLVILGILAVVLVGDGSSSDKFFDVDANHKMAAVWIAFGISFVAGAQGNAFHKDHGMLYGNIAVTFVVQMAFNFLVQSFFKKEGINGEPNIKWSGIFFGILLGFAGGGAIGFLVDKFVFMGASIFLPAIIALIILLIARGRQFESVDPTPGGRFA